MRNTLKILALTACYCASAWPAEQVQQIAFNDCNARLTYSSDAESMSYKNSCEMSLQERLSSFWKLIQAMPDGVKNLKQAGHFSTGRLEITTPEFAARLALAASRDPDWDSRKGQLSESGKNKYATINHYVTDLANRDNIYKELRQCFNQLGLELSLASVEKVLVGTRDQAPFGPLLFEYASARTAHLPYDAITWYQLSEYSGPLPSGSLCSYLP